MDWVRRVAVAAAIVLAAWLVSLIPLPISSERAVVVDGPVIAADEGWDTFPSGKVRGYLRLSDGCLLLNGAVVFWPHGTLWNDERESVVFGGAFDGARGAPVGGYFRGGGGVFASEAEYGDVLRDRGVEAVNRCLSRTGATVAVVAYPLLRTG